MPVETQDVDKGFQRIIDEFSMLAVGEPFVVAGLLQDAGDAEDGTPLVVAAATNEFGTFEAGKNRNVEIPARPAFRTAFDLNKAKYVQIQLEQRDRFLAGEIDHKGILEVIGTEMATDIVDSIKLWLFPPNAPSTVKQKGFNNPLTQSGLTAVRVSHEVRDRFNPGPSGVDQQSG